MYRSVFVLRLFYSVPVSCIFKRGVLYSSRLYRHKTRVESANLNSLLLSPLQGGPGCEYCRITRADVKRVLGFNSMEAFGSESDSDACKRLRSASLWTNYTKKLR